jgi:AcrR family transcriptional regulator
MATETRHGQVRISQEVVEEHQRRHLIAAVAEVVGRLGVEPSGEEIVAAARVSRMSIYRLFGNKRGCVEAACTAAGELLAAPLRTAARAQAAWPRRLEVGLGALLEAAAREPAMAALCLIHSAGLVAPTAAGPAVLRAALGELLEGGREAGREAQGADYREPPASAELFVAAGMVALLEHRVGHGGLEPCAEQLGELTGFAGAQFIGS